MAKKPWGGRFRAPLSKSAEKFTQSISYDRRLYKVDIVQSIAYAEALQKAKVLTHAECAKIVKGLEAILKSAETGRVNFRPDLEDIHMNVETLLIEKIGEVGKKLHTGRSRNDQVATDLRMYLKWETTETLVLIRRLSETVLDLAEKNIKVIMPGYTHLQKAQPVLFAHQMLAYVEMLARDKERMEQAYDRMDVMPLGSGALSGNNFEIDRHALAKALGFSGITDNSLDAVSDRDFVIDYISAAAQLMMHLSRFAEEIILWSTNEFGFIELSDGYSTGSSLMPQKKNPDVAELVRGKSGRVYGNLMAILTVMKAQPLAYNRDMQEDKEALFDTVDTVKDCLAIFSEMIATMKVREDAMRKSAGKGYLTATDLAYYLVKQNVPFRQAHEIVGRIVAYCEESNMELEYVSLNQLKQFSDRFSYDVQRILSAEASVNSKITVGGTSPKRVKEAITRARANFLHDKA
ncbi:MAG TPA: argininosuccinate lyase [Candidatus Omnitrophota bacterium]|nr:argininosuccinate lyase [Candidatus Omnitrophota bacterium]